MNDLVTTSVLVVALPVDRIVSEPTVEVSA